MTTLKGINKKIRAFEAHFGVDSETMRREVASGSRRETLDICEWLILLRVQERIREKK